jgi:hypothetical protein
MWRKVTVTPEINRDAPDPPQEEPVLDTAHATAAPTTDAPDAHTTTQPVRMLVPTTRRSHLFLPEPDTLRASDLGITRHTTDEELDTIAADLELAGDQAVTFMTGRGGTLADNLHRLRDALAQPRDIDEAEEWGLHIPITEWENAEEENPNPNKRLGWWWVYDLNRRETRQQRRARYQLDHRLVDTKGLARLLCRAYHTTKGLKASAAWARGILDDVDFRTEEAGRYSDKNPHLALSTEDAARELVAKATKMLLKATAAPVERAGQSDLFDVWASLDAGRVSELLNEWYAYNRKKQTGRPKGSRTRRPVTA